MEVMSHAREEEVEEVDLEVVEGLKLALACCDGI